VLRVGDRQGTILSESGLRAVGMCGRDASGAAVAALSVAAPAARYSADKRRLFIAELTAIVTVAQAEAL
jgi:DNA-binding IclR family transcriptional regulator